MRRKSFFTKQGQLKWKTYQINNDGGAWITMKRGEYFTKPKKQLQDPLIGDDNTSILIIFVKEKPSITGISKSWKWEKLSISLPNDQL